MALNSNARTYAERQMRRLGSPIVQSKLGTDRAMQLIGNLWVLCDNPYTDSAEIMRAVNQVNRLLNLKEDEVSKS